MKKWVHRGRNPPNLKVTKGLGRNPLLWVLLATSIHNPEGRQNISPPTQGGKEEALGRGWGVPQPCTHLPQALGYCERSPGFC